MSQKPELYRKTAQLNTTWRRVTIQVKGALKALNSKSGKIPAGAMIVIENFSPKKKLAAITVMYRAPSFDSNADDWFWLKYGPDGKVMKEGKVAGCINCHLDVKGNDWLFTGPIK